jgi:hypothetical protein
MAKLAYTLTESKHDKARISAAVSLGRLKDKRALKPLVRALRDKNRVVRAVAADALGRLDDDGAIPALRRATRDSDRTVRRKATEAIVEIRRRGKSGSRRQTRDHNVSYSITAREPPRLDAPKPDLFVVLKSTSDKSSSKDRKNVRKAREQRMKKLMTASLDSVPKVTMSATEAKSHGLEPYNIDISIMKFQRTVAGPWVEIECQLRIAVSSPRGKMLSFLTGGAKVQVPKRTFRRQYEPRLKLEALDNAVKGIHQDVVTYLRRNPS